MPFDIAFSELFVVAVIALIVLGPERLPIAARTLGKWIGKAKRAFSSVKNEINRELQIDELRDQIRKQQEQMDGFIKQQSIDDFARDTQAQIDETRAVFDQALEDQQQPSTGCDNPVEYEPLPRGKKTPSGKSGASPVTAKSPTIHPAPNDQPDTTNTDNLPK